MTTYVTCRVCGEQVGKLGIGKHAKMHKREYADEFGEWPTDYDDVVDWVGSRPDDTSLDQF